MSKLRTFSFNGLDLLVSPYLHKEGDLIRSVNVDNFPIGAKTKRPGYVTFLTNPDSQPVTALFDWHRSDGTTFNLYRVSGGIVRYSLQGTGAWTIAGNGTITNGATPGTAVLEDTLMIGDGTAPTKHTTDGINFIDTTAAPLASYFCDFQQRIYAAGTTDIFYSTTGTPSDWISDSSSIHIPGAGNINQLFKLSDRLIIPKNQGNVFRYDGYNLFDMSTAMGPTAPWSLGKIEGHAFWLNYDGVQAFDGDAFTLTSNVIGRQIFNDAQTGIQGSVFRTAPGKAYRWDYMLAVGSFTDDLTSETVYNGILDYDYQHNEWTNYDFGTLPTTWCSFIDNTGVKSLIFGDSSGQCYEYGGTAVSDNGQPIHATMEGVIHFGSPEADKKFNYMWVMTNPGCQAHMQVAIANTFTKATLKWISIGDLTDGITEMRFPKDTDGKLMFWKFTESSMQDRFTLFGFVIDVDILERQ